LLQHAVNIGLIVAMDEGDNLPSFQDSMFGQENVKRIAMLFQHASESAQGSHNLEKTRAKKSTADVTYRQYISYYEFELN